MKKLAIVSTDGHAGPLVDTYRAYLEPQYHGDLDELIEEENEFLAITSKIGVFSPSQLALIDGDGRIASGGIAGAWDLDRRLAEMDREGIAVEVFLQGHQSASCPFFGPQNRYFPADIRMAGVRAFNRWQYDMVREAGGRLIGVVEQTPVADLDDAIAEVRWGAEHGFRAVAFPGVTDPNLPQPAYTDPYWEPFWRACADADLALVLHVGLGTPQGMIYELFKQRAATMVATDDDYDRNAREFQGVDGGGDQIDDAMMKSLMELNYSPRDVFWQLMVGGVFDRYPNLRYVPTEARADWVPATLARMDERYERGDTPLTRRPSEYWADHGFAGASFIHRAELEDRAAIGIDNLMFGRDYPHPEGTWPNTREWLRAAFAGVPEDDARKILGANAIRCYGLDPATVDAIAERVGPDVSEILGDHEVDAQLLDEFEKRGGYAKPAPPLATDTLDQIMDRSLVGA